MNAPETQPRDTNNPCESTSGKKGKNSRKQEADNTDVQPAGFDLVRFEKITALATQLACAQITATAQFDAAHMVARANAELVERMKNFILLHTGIDGHLTKKSIIGQYEAYGMHPPLLLLQPDSILQEKARPLDDPSLDQIFISAMKRAHTLLTPPDTDTSEVYAEQLFEPGKVLSGNKIGDVFNKWKWPNLRSRGDFVERFQALEKWCLGHYDSLDLDEHKDEDAKPDYDSQFIEHAEEFVRKHTNKPEYAELNTALIQLARQRDTHQWLNNTASSAKSVGELPSIYSHF